MRHRKKKVTLDRDAAGRGALLKNLAGDLLVKEKIQTTEAKAKALRPIVEKLITLAKKQTLASRRLLSSRLPLNGSADKTFEVIAKRYIDRAGGYTRIIKLPTRVGDGASQAIIELV